MSNGNPICGKKIQITKNGKTSTAKIMDICPGEWRGSSPLVTAGADTSLFASLL